ncbi:hypothetical protein JCM16161A_10260 [Vulcanisaeta sp. JCM 16161]|uniref:hypothetical protein n=1 Tax=Vulcanisaeta sp. JCM 16161 TaxID=1295372 RepID=UPI0006CFDE80|nr:hypothetical protein [Vulcanisaeta sp. JCM 16161]
MALKVSDTIMIYYGKCKSGKKCIPIKPVTDLEKRQEVIELLNEAINRIEERNIWSTQWIDEMYAKITERVMEIFKRFKDNNEYTKEIIDVTNEISRFLLNHLGDKFKEYWLNNVSNEIKELIDNLTNNKLKILINETEKSLMVHVYWERIGLNVNKIFPSGSIVVQLIIKGLSGFYIDVPDVFRKLMGKKEYRKFIKKVIISMRLGWAATDESKRENNKPAIATTQLWQVLLWLLLYPGRVYVITPIINVNKSNITIVWQLRAYDHKSLKLTALNDAIKLDNVAFLIFMLAVILGDGDVTIESLNNSVKPMIRLTIGSIKFENWRLILNKLKTMGIEWSKIESGGKINIVISTNYAIDLAKLIISALPPLMSALLNILENLGLEKWSILKLIANMELNRRKGNAQIEIAGIKFTVRVTRSAVELQVLRKNETEADEIIKQVKNVYGKDFDIRKRKYNNKIKIIIPWVEILRHNDIKAKVVTKLYEMLNRIKDDKRRKWVNKNIRKLTMN